MKTFDKIMVSQYWTEIEGQFMSDGWQDENGQMYDDEEIEVTSRDKFSNPIRGYVTQIKPQ